jgi:hypothetical protein
LLEYVTMSSFRLVCHGAERCQHVLETFVQSMFLIPDDQPNAVYYLCSCPEIHRRCIAITNINYIKPQIDFIVQCTIESRTVWYSNNMKLEQKIRGKSGFQTRTKTRKSNKESHGRHVVAFSLCLVACAVAQPVLPWLVQWSSCKFSLFLSVLFIPLAYFYRR